MLIRLEETTLDQIVGGVGRGHIDRSGDDHDLAYWLCYCVPGSPWSQRLWIIAHGEMGGPEHRVGAVVVYQVEGRVSAPEACPSLPPAFKDISLDRGVRIGTQLTELLRILGRPSARREDWLMFQYAGKVAGKFRGPGDTVDRVVDFDEIGSLEARVVSERVAALRVSKTTTY
jgi:hypothetical protein